MRFGEVVSDDADEMYGLAKNARSQCRVTRRAAEEVFLSILGRFDIIEGDGSGDDD